MRFEVHQSARYPTDAGPRKSVLATFDLKISAIKYADMVADDWEHYHKPVEAVITVVDTGPTVIHKGKGA